MRLTGIEKGGLYPYPIHMAEAAASLFIQPQETRCLLLDPCAGESEIASALGVLLNCESWGCGLFPYLTEKAFTHMEGCHRAIIRISIDLLKIRSLTDIASEYPRKLA